MSHQPTSQSGATRTDEEWDALEAAAQRAVEASLERLQQLRDARHALRRWIGMPPLPPSVFDDPSSLAASLHAAGKADR